MAVTDQQKLDFLLKKIGYTKTKTGSVVGTGAISGTPKQPFAEAIPSPLVVPNSSLWNEAGSIPATPPGSDTPQVKVYLVASSGLRMTADSTSSGQRAYIAYSTYGNTSSARLTNWIDTQFGASYLIKVYKGDPNSGGVALSAAGSGANDGWFFDYSAGVLNFNDTSVPSGVTDTNIYIVGYRYIGQTGAPTSGISTFSNLDLTVERNLDVGKQGGISTFRHNVQLLDNDKLQFGDGQDLEFYHNGTQSIITNSTGQLIIQNSGTNTFHQSNNSIILSQVNNGNNKMAQFTYGGSAELYHNNSKKFETTSTGINVTGDGVFSGNVSIGGTLTYEDVKNVDSVGIVTARAGIRVTGGVIEAQAGENKIPSLYAAMGNLPSAGSYHGMFAHVHATGRGYFAHAGNWLELVNREINGVVGTGTETYNIGNLVSTSSTVTSLNVVGVSTFGDDVNFTTQNGNNLVLDKSDNSLKFGDSVKAKFGTGSDLEIYHDTAASIIENKNLALNLYSKTDIQLRSEKGAGMQIYAIFRENGNNEFYFNNSKKLETTNIGIKATGQVEATTNMLLNGTNGSLFFGSGTTYHNNAGIGIASNDNYHVVGSLAGDLVLGAKVGENIVFGTNSSGFATKRLKIASDGNVSVTNDFDVDGHTNLDNVSIAGVTTIAQDLDVDGHTNLDNVSISGVTTFTGNIGGTATFQDIDVDGHTNLDNVNVAGVSTFAGTVNTASIVATGIDLNGDLDVDGHTNLDNVSIAGVTTFSSKIGVHDGTTGSNGQYLRATGTGVTWANFPTMRTSQTTTASSGQTVFNFTYNVGYLDVFVNGVKLTSSEFTATNGSNVILSVGSFVGDIVELVSYFTTSYAAGSSGLGEIVEDTTPQLGGNLDMFNKSITGTGNINITGIVTATNFVGDGSGLTGITASGSGVVVKDSGSTVGTAGTINFGDNLSVSPASAGIVTITGSAGVSTSQFDVNKLDVSGISTFKGAVDINADIDVDGHTNLDNVSIAGVVTATTFVGALTGNVTGNVSGNATGLTGNPTINVTDLDVDGHTNLDNVSVAGVTTFTGAMSASDIRSNALTLKNAAGSASYAVFSNGGSAELNWNNTKRLETTTSGVTVTGTVAATSYTGDGSQLTGVGVQTSQFNVNKLDVSGISTFKGNIDVNADLDVDGHTNLDNVSIAGVVTATTFSGSGASLTGISNLNISNSAAIGGEKINPAFTSNVIITNADPRLDFIDTNHNSDYRLTNSNGTFVLYDTTNTTTRLSVASNGNVSVTNDLDVDGHTNLDNVSVAGVVTATTFVGALTGNVTGNTSGSSGSCTGNAATATALQNARTIGGVSFDGTANINLPGVNAAGTQDTSGTAAVATNVTVSANNTTNETVYPVFVDGATGTQGAETDTGLTYNPSTGNLTSTKFTGDGSGLTGITASGTGIVIKNSGSTVGTAGTINFGDNLSVSAISGGAVTITAPASSGGISTISGVVNIVNDLNVDGHTNLDNVSIAGFTTITQDLNVDGHTNLDNVSISGVVTATSFVGSAANLTGLPAEITINNNGTSKVITGSGTANTLNANVNLTFDGTTLDVKSGNGVINTGQATVHGDLDVDGHTNLDNVNIAGFTTVTQDLDVDGHTNLDNATIAGVTTFIGNVNLNTDLDVDGHTNLDNVSIAGVVTASTFSGSGASLTSIPAGQLTGTVADARISTLTASKLSGALPAISAANLTNIPAANITGTLPAISGANLTNLDASDLASGTIPDARFPATLPAVSGANLTGLAPNVGITTNLSGTFTASAGSPSTINTFGYGSGDLVVEYTIYIKNGSDFQTQKLLVMRDGTTIHSTQFAVMFSSSLLVQCDATISSGNILLRATPETGVSGSTTYKVKREVM